MRHQTRKLLFRAILLAMTWFSINGIHSAAAQEAETSQQLWLDYNPSWMISPKLTVGGDVGYRKRIDEGTGARLVLRPGVDHPYKHVIFKAGIGNFWTISDEIDNRWEIRPYQGVGWVWPRTWVLFDHLARLEERFDLNTVDWSSANSLRARYRLRLRYVFAMTRPDRFWRAFGSGEVFVKLAGEEGVQQEQFRVTMGLERSFNRLMRLRAQITWQQEELFFLPGESVDAVYFRLRVYQNF